MKKIFIILGLIANGLLSFSQTNPTPQPLPYSQNFSVLDGLPGAVYPDGFQGWRIVEAEPNLSGRVNPPTANVNMKSSGSNATTAAGVYDFTGKIGLLSSTYNDLTIALALNTSSVTAPQQVRITFDAMTMLNIYDGTINNYRLGLVFQYRIGTSGNFTPTDAIFESGTTPNATSGTNGQDITPFSILLPVECSGQPVVQVRWVCKRISGNSGQRQSFAIDNITAEGVTVENGTYHVDADAGDDNNDGLTPATAWQSLTKVNSVTFLPGAKILFKAGGIWSGQLWPKGSGIHESPIIIDSYGTGPKPIINGDGIIQAGALKLYNQSFWEINNLEITNDASADAERRGIEVIGNNFGLLEHIYLKNLTVHDIRGTVGNEMSDKRSAGIYFTVQNDNTVDTRFHDIRVEDCLIYNCQNQGIVTSHEISVSDYPKTPNWERRKITNLLIKNNTIHHISKNAMIIRLADGGLVERNLCYETATGTTGNTIFSRSSINTVFQYNEGYLNRSPDYDGSLYDPDLNSPGTIWQYSYSHDNAHGLFWLCSSLQDTGIVCRYNISQNDKGSLVFMNFDVTDVNVYNNTFYIGTGLSPTIVHENPNRSHTYAYHNNIVYNANTTPTPAKFSLATTGTGVQNRTITDNIFYNTTQPAQIDFITQNLTSDPLFINPGSGGIGLNTVGGYKLQPGSPALNSGKIIADNGGKDYFGIAVSATAQPNRGFYNGPGTTIAEADPDFHIYLLTGQSNMVGSGPLATSVDSTSPQIKMMTENFEWVEASHPISYLPNAGVGPGLGFATKMLESAGTNVRIGIINTAVGGQPISAFAPGAPNSRTSSSIYDESVNRVNIARTQGVLKGVLFHQGESNSGDNYSSWTNRVKELIENLRNDFNDPTLPFIVGELGHFRATSPNINNQLPQLVSEVPYTAWVSAEGLTDKGDGIHFDSPSASELGVRYALALLGNEDLESTVPDTTTNSSTALPAHNLDIRVSSVVSPNGDGINDFLSIEGIEKYSDNRVIIFNSKGNILKEINGYDNNQRVFTATNIQNGTYFYRLVVTAEGKRQLLQGFFEVRK
ncbi:T9SS type B sorting domain-containing protein [Parapedobacter sp. SGR-10]|uniref:sialate O-acetylesterase n=1 Tax=Parapedobacter sp. SGR-10 TaxID=2710879 RepID=UPI0013D72959|nr:sialate O-acetylesterase [Parapedobacter sp. SGR-10]NGF55836.1 T9SS type B sorting domain-containing protein [Parapedobacter sp. SGR-10]